MAGSMHRSSAIRRAPARGLLAAALVVLATSTLACAPPSQLPDGTVAQLPPVGINGLATADGGGGAELWGADLFGGQLLRFDADSGVIAERYGPFEDLCGTDDLVVLPEGDLVATCPQTGEVIRVSRGGDATVIATVGDGVNPIELDASGDAVLVGFGTEEHDELIRVPLDGSPIEVLADGLPVLNGFSFGPDGLLYVPTGGAGGLLGTGGLGRIDIATGDFEQLELSFVDPARRGFSFACGVDVADDGTVFVAQCVDASLWAVDPTTGTAARVGRSPLPLADNVAVLGDGRVLLSGFLGPQVAVFTPLPDGSWRSSVLRVGS